MKRTALYLVAASFLLLGNAKQASACCYIPWLDPLAWMGFYGCGPNPWMSGCGTGQCGYGGGYRANYGYAQPSYNSYVPSYPALNYQAAPVASDCGCQGASLSQPQQQLSAYRVPVTTYRAVTQYVPQTTYRTQYRYQQAQVAQAQPTAPLAYGYSGATTAYGYGYGASTLPTAVPQSTAYNVAPAATYGTAPTYNTAAAYTPAAAYNTATVPAYPTAPTNGYTSYDANPVPSPRYPVPSAPASPSFYQPRTFQAPTGDIAGDHEMRPQTATLPVIPNSYSGKIPVRRATYGAAPRTTRSFSSTVR
ncbi:MAG: hypothetical protein ABJZ55_01760 [Fuerstiella sp.]